MKPLRLLPVLLLSILSCVQQKETGLSGELGVSFGGQIQKRDVVLVAGKTFPELTFKVASEPPIAESRSVSWELAYRNLSGHRTFRRGEVQLQGGREELLQTLPMPENPRFGRYDVRVVVGNQLLIDRSVVFKPAPAL